MPDLVYTYGKLLILSGGVSLSDPSVNIKVMLVNAGYIPDPDHHYVSDGVVSSPANFEVTGTGYTPGESGSGRRTIANKLFTANLILNKARFSGDNVTWVPINVGPIEAAVVYVAGTSDATSTLLGYIQSGGFPFLTDGGEFQLRWNSNGIITL